MHLLTCNSDVLVFGHVVADGIRCKDREDIHVGYVLILTLSISGLA